MANAAKPFSSMENGLWSLSTHESSRSLGANQHSGQSRQAEKKGRSGNPSYLIIDSQSVKTNYEGESIGFHGGKKIKGRSRQVAVDTQGNIWSVYVHAANAADTVQGCKLADKAFKRIPCIQAVCADAGYRGTFVDYVNETWGKAVHISEKIKDGFAVLPKRWVVERTFAWLNGNRRLSKDYEKTTSSSESQVLIASISRNLKLF